MPKFQKQPAGTQRTFKILVCFRPQVKEVVHGRLAQINETLKAKGKNPWTISEFVRQAVWAFSKQPDDPREP